MSEFKKILDGISDNLTQFVKKYEQLDNHEPFSFSITDSLKKQIKSFYAAASSIDNLYSVQKDSAEKSVNALLSNYSKKESALEQELKENIKDVSLKYKEQTIAIQNQIELSAKKVKQDEADALMDVDWFKASSDMNIDMFEREYQGSMNRYDYHIQIAKESYSQNTIQYNNLLENEIQEIEKNYSEVLVDYDKQTKSIIDNYQKNIDKLIATQKEKLEQQERVEAEHKDRGRVESIKLNDKIRSLVQKRNDNIAQAKTNYAQKQNNAQQEKDSKRQSYQTESQKLSRLFVINMTKLDEKITEIKNTYNLNTDMEKRNLYYRLLELKKEQEKDLSVIFDTYSGKSAKRNARMVNRTYFRYQTIEVINNEKTIKNLTHGFHYATEENTYDRKLLDIDRAYSIKHILEEENRDNKYYQEMNNIFETDMNLEISLENLEYSREANRIRFENNLKSVVEEKEFDEKLAFYQIENEQLTSQIKTIRNEINSLTEVKELIHRLEEKKYITNLNFKTINNTLEIEKHKVLDTFNQQLYDLNAKSAKLILDFSKELTYKKNDEFETDKKNKTTKSYKLLAIEERNGQHQLEIFVRNEAYEIRVLKRNYFYELDKLGHNLLSQKWTIEIKELQQCLAALSQILEEMEFMGIESTNVIFKTIVFRPEYTKIIWIFMKEFISIIYNSLKDLIDVFKNSVHDLIEKRLETEESLKYKGFYKNLESQYQESMKELNSQKNAAMVEMNNYQSKIDENNNSIFSIDNDLFLKRKMEYGTKSYKAAVLEANTQKKDLRAENAKLSKTLAVYTKESNRVQQKILELDRSYARQQEDIRKMQITNAKCYYSLRKDIEKLCASSISEMYQKVHLSDVPESELHNYEAIVAQRVATFVAMNQNMIGDFENVLNNFKIGEKQAILTSGNILQNSYTTDILEIRRDLFNEEYESKNSYSSDIRVMNEDIRKFDLESAEQAKQFKKEIQTLDKKIKHISDVIQKEREQITDIFYEEYYAICDNQKDIINKLNNDINNFHKEYEEKRRIILDKFNSKNEVIKEAFKEYKEKKEEDVRLLPARVKENHKSMKEETHKKNLEIAESIDEAKIKSTMDRKATNKNLLSINSAFEAKQQEIEKEKKSIIAKEKKKYAQAIKRL